MSCKAHQGEGGARSSGVTSRVVSSGESCEAALSQVYMIAMAMGCGCGCGCWCWCWLVRAGLRGAGSKRGGSLWK